MASPFTSMTYFGNSTSDYDIPTPKTPAKNYKRDDRLRVQTLFFDAGWSTTNIALQLNLTFDQVKYALRRRITPQKQRSGCRPFLGPIERKQLIDWGGRDSRWPRQAAASRVKVSGHDHISKVGLLAFCSTNSLVLERLRLDLWTRCMRRRVLLGASRGGGRTGLCWCYPEDEQVILRPPATPESRRKPLLGPAICL